MTQIDKSKPVMVTGATGYVAGWIVKRLLDEGLTVHASVRDHKSAEKLQYLNKIAGNAPGEIIFYEADLLAEGSYAGAMAGCQIVFHTASPFKLDVADPQMGFAQCQPAMDRRQQQGSSRVEYAVPPDKRFNDRIFPAIDRQRPTQTGKVRKINNRLYASGGNRGQHLHQS